MLPQHSTIPGRREPGYLDHNPTQQRLLLAARGWHLFPLAPGKKIGYPGRHGYKDATTDPARLTDPVWWPTGSGTGIATGASGLVVIDLDNKQDRPTAPEHQVWAERGCWDGASVFTWQWERLNTDGTSWAHAYTVLTPSGGAHLYFRAPAEPIRNSASGALGWQVDVRAAGGHVAAPGTVLPNGRYEPLWEPETLPVLPDWITRKLTAPVAPRRPARPAQRSALTLPSQSAGRVAALAKTVANAAEGTRNDTLNWAAHALAVDGALTQAHAAALLDAATAAGLTETESVATIRSAHRGVAA